MSADLEELFRASVHLHKDMHTLDEKLDRIEALLLTIIEASLLTMNPAAPPTAGTIS